MLELKLVHTCMGRSCFPSSADDVSGRNVDLSQSAPLSTSLEQQNIEEVAVAAPRRPVGGAEWRCCLESNLRSPMKLSAKFRQEYGKIKKQNPSPIQTPKSLHLGLEWVQLNTIINPLSWSPTYSPFIPGSTCETLIYIVLIMKNDVYACFWTS